MGDLSDRSSGSEEGKEERERKDTVRAPPPAAVDTSFVKIPVGYVSLPARLGFSRTREGEAHGV